MAIRRGLWKEKPWVQRLEAAKHSNVKHVQHVLGRKIDVQDCQWLAQDLPGLLMWSDGSQKKAGSWVTLPEKADIELRSTLSQSPPSSKAQESGPKK